VRNRLRTLATCRPGADEIAVIPDLDGWFEFGLTHAEGRTLFGGCPHTAIPIEADRVAFAVSQKAGADKSLSMGDNRPNACPKDARPESR